MAELTIAEKLTNLFVLQMVDSKIDEIQIMNYRSKDNVFLNIIMKIFFIQNMI